jgi:hypothetical protein
VEGSRRTGDSIEGVCAVCKAPVSRDSSDSTSLDVDGGVYYCAEHRNSLPKDCGNCHFAVTGQAVRALGRLWHEECFCCSVCEARIDDDVSAQFAKQGTWKIWANTRHALLISCTAILRARWALLLFEAR